MRIFLLLTCNFLFFGNLYAQYGFDTLRIYFDIGSYHPGPASLNKLDSLAITLQQQPSGILIYGYADYLGTEVPNQALSEQRATTVRDYLQSKGVSGQWILTTMGMGQRVAKLPGEKGNPFNRRTEILIKRKHAATVVENPLLPEPEPKPQLEPNSTPPIIDLTAVQEEETIVLEQIHFYESMHKIMPASIPALQALLRVMRDNPTLEIQIEGHICCVTSFPDAMDIETGMLDLSIQRAKMVRDFLVYNGIAPARLRYKGLGNSKPLVPVELTEEDRIKNRRVAIRILKK